ncbi:MAG TPA: hypothetical protein VFN61_15670 [Acidimicrobiales bacterium]|nr:hypothetical protein [Acidimicrobiales bacterium]
MGSKRPRPVVLDAGALIAIDRGDRRIIRLLELADEVHVPAGALAQALRNPARQVRLARVVAAVGVTIDPLDGDNARAAGQLCGATGTADIVDASVVVLTRAVDGLVVTSDAGDLRRLDPGVVIVTC